MLENRLHNSGCVDYALTAEVIREVDALAEARKAAIRNAKDEITITGTAYYVSEHGDDNNDGLSKETPLRTIDKVNSLKYNIGDGVYFERGGIYRGSLGGIIGVTYAAYGEGRKPRLYSSPENGSDPAKWSLVEGTDNIWRYATRMCDVGVIVFNDGEAYTVRKIPSFVDGKYVCRGDRVTPFDVTRHMDHDLTHFCRQDDLLDANGLPDTREPISEIFLRCDKGNPGEVFDSIEFAAKIPTIRAGQDYITIDNLCVMYCGSCSISSGGHRLGLHVTNCEFGWIGGSIQYYVASGDKKGDVVRLGNAIEIYGGCDDYVCADNYIYQCYDAGVTHQYSAGGTNDCKQKNIRFTNNLIEYCTYSYEYFLGKPSAPDCVRFQQNILIKDNIMRYAGFGFGEQRPSPDNYFPAAHVKGWDHANYLDENFVMEGNIFDRSRNMMLHVCAEKAEYLPEMKNNIYIQYNSVDVSSFARWGIAGKDALNIPCNESLRSVMTENGIDPDAGVYFAERDELYDLPDFLPKHDRQ